jgi:hypothetical protein
MPPDRADAGLLVMALECRPFVPGAMCKPCQMGSAPARQRLERSAVLTPLLSARAAAASATAVAAIARAMATLPPTIGHARPRSCPPPRPLAWLPCRPACRPSPAKRTMPSPPPAAPVVEPREDPAHGLQPNACAHRHHRHLPPGQRRNLRHRVGAILEGQTRPLGPRRG